VESKWKNYHITTFPGQSLSPNNLRDVSSGDKLKIALFGDLNLEEDMDLSRDRQILEHTYINVFMCLNYNITVHNIYMISYLTSVMRAQQNLEQLR
jgi:hypothetical protein